MITFIIFALFCWGATGVVVFRRRFALRSYAADAQDEPTFAHFMEDCIHQIGVLWHSYIREHILLFTEKQLRWVRILVLKVERILFHATHRVRGASVRNGNGAHENHSSSNEENKI